MNNSVDFVFRRDLFDKILGKDQEKTIIWNEICLYKGSYKFENRLRLQV